MTGKGESTSYCKVESLDEGDMRIITAGCFNHALEAIRLSSAVAKDNEALPVLLWPTVSPGALEIMGDEKHAREIDASHKDQARRKKQIEADEKVVIEHREKELKMIEKETARQVVKSLKTCNSITKTGKGHPGPGQGYKKCGEEEGGCHSGCGEVQMLRLIVDVTQGD
ncbi:hypothetical protein L218DRAFT_943850 [Marasmius fiardii PR-910]|nr:hypothetical protein L218DRAFT_943850 [Marasmius fiardii PR-910]